MSAKDSQFIERALVHPWMFWVFFWKWPRIVRQVCGEYDLVAKDRDAAKAAHEQAVAANEKVRKWIHVTHQLDATADLRAIWTAGKRLSILLVLFVVTNTYGQAPPYLRNQWTTNANPLALKVISTNGVHAATNVWELDFTNTATVTVSAVSNANKVMVSFTGSASSGSSSLTNALLHAGPTNGSVGALILTAGNGVTLTTSGTNRIAAIDTNVVAEISDLIWTNYGSTAYTLSAMPGTIQVFTNASVKVSPSSLIDVTLTNGSTAAFEKVTSAPNSSIASGSGSHGGAFFERTDNVTVDSFEGSMAGGYFFRATNCYVAAYGGGYAGCEINNGYDCEFLSTIGMVQGLVNNSTNTTVETLNGGLSVGRMEASLNTTISSGGGAFVGGYLQKTRDTVFILRNGALGGIMSYDHTNGSHIANAALVSLAINGTNTSSIINTGAVAVAVLGSNEKMQIEGSLSGCGSLGVGRDLVGTNNWTFGIHYTNLIPLSLAVGANGTTQFRAASNSVVIRTETAPTVGQILTATDTSGTVGWSNAPAASGGGVASIFTNNVLAGGPGLTELEFTNSSTVTVAATTNAGRVTVSFDASVAGSGIATNEGTGWLTTFFGQTNWGNITFTNGARIEQPSATITRFTNSTFNFGGNMTFTPGATYDVTGARDVNVSRNLGWTSASQMQAPANGRITLYNFSGTDFTRLEFGGVTASFPALKRDGAGLAIVGGGGVGASDNNLYVSGSLVVTNFIRAIGPITNDTLTASTVLAADATKEIVSIANGAGVLTNDGAGVVGYMSLGSFGGGGDGAGIKVWTNEVAVGVGTNLDLIAGDNITILATNLTGAGGTNAISIGLTTSINTRQVGSAVLTNLAATRAVTNMTVTTITNVGVSLYTVPAGCTYIWVECIGGGGGGGGVDGAASQSAAGGGGGSGAYCSTNIGSPAASYIVTVGTNGLGGAGTGGNAGTIGGTTLFTNILTALGGSGGAGKSSAAAVSITLGGAGALETATGRVYTGGNPGHNGICVSGTLAISGGGAGSHFGGGGAPQTAAVGANATGKGAGGSGAAVITNADRNGGNGSPGIIVIREFYQ